MSDEEHAGYLAWKEQPYRQSFVDLLEEARLPPLVRLYERVRELLGD